MIRKGTIVVVRGDEDVGISSYTAKVLKLTQNKYGDKFVVVIDKQRNIDEVPINQVERYN